MDQDPHVDPEHWLKVIKNSQNSRNQGFNDGRIRSRIREAQKPTDPDTDPDPQH